MGLLDDAIREHLELKRLRGADPGDVAREEKDALGPVPRGSTDTEGHEDSRAEASAELGGPFLSEAESAPAANPSMASDLNQETVEINMDAELAAGIDGEGERQERGSAERARADSVQHPAHAPADTEQESLEWEMPGDAHIDEGSKAPELVEDVLEETPDFLRDTPEQERLWFEQRPPRDFDFNE
jgi:hypothetical protein